MARPTSWLPRLPDILRAVSNSIRTHYDRPALERLFHIQPRAAGKLMDLLPQVEALGRSRLVERDALLSFLEAVRAADDPEAYLATRRAAPAPVSRRKPRPLVRREALEEASFDNLTGITLQPGRLELRFQDLQQFTDGMTAIAALLEHRLEEFIDRYIPTTEEERQRQNEDREVQRELAAWDNEFRSWMATKRATKTTATTETQHPSQFPAIPLQSLPLRHSFPFPPESLS